MTQADKMLQRYEDLLHKAGGKQRITVDGQSVTFEDLEKKHAYWQREVARQKGIRPELRRIDLS